MFIIWNIGDSKLHMLNSILDDRSCAGGTADCMGVGLRDIPRNFPSETVTIDLTDNQLTDIQQSDFPVQSNVQNLRLSRNGLSAIAPRTFSNMERLMSLDLSLNPITRVHDKSFEGLSKLRSIQQCVCIICHFLKSCFFLMLHVSNSKLNVPV